MGILGRLSTLVKSNVNDLIDGMQDPAKEIDQLVRDMEDSVRQARGEVAQCLAEEKRLGKRVNDVGAASQRWEEHAMRAGQGGDDAPAKEALKRKGEKEGGKLEAAKLAAGQEGPAEAPLA